jgi:hypothetical protein
MLDDLRIRHFEEQIAFALEQYDCSTAAAENSPCDRRGGNRAITIASLDHFYAMPAKEMPAQQN